MPLPVINYAAIEPQGNPAMRALVPALIQGMKLAKEPKMMDAELQKQQLANALSKLNLQYAPRQNEAELGLTNAKTGFLGQQSQYYGPDMMSQIGLRNAQTNEMNQESGFIPLKYALQASNSMRANDRFGNSYQLKAALQNMSPAARGTWIAQNQDAYNQMLTDVANGQQSSGSNIVENMVRQSFPSPPTQLTLSPEEKNNLVGAGIAKVMQGNNSGNSTMQTLPINSKMQNMFGGSTPEQNQQIQLANQMSANNDLTTNYSRKQGEAAAKLDNWLKEAQPQYASAMQNISQYAGLLGKGKKGLDALKSENPQAYKDYQWFTNTFRTNIDALITQMEGTSITNTQQQDYKKMLSSAVDNLTTDPKSAIEQMNLLWDTIGKISEQRAEIAQPIFKNTYKDAYNYEGIPSPYIGNQGLGNAAPRNPTNRSSHTDEDIAFTAKKYGMTIDQVKQKMGIR